MDKQFQKKELAMKLVKRMERLQTDNFFHDVHLIYPNESERIPSVKKLLAIQSNYFLREFSSKDSCDDEFNLPYSKDIHISIFKKLHNFVFTASLDIESIPLEDQINLFRLAKLYEFEVVTSCMIKYFKLKMSVNICWELLNLSAEFTLEDLGDVCTETIKQVPNLVTNPKLLTLNIQTLEFLLSRKTFTLPEVELTKIRKAWNETPMNTNELTKLITNDTVHYDMINENAIYDETYKLAKSLEFCEQIVTAAHQLADYVPDLSNDQHSEFWKQKVIPNLVESLIQNERARIIIIESFASIRDLAIIIQRAGEILKQTRGSKKAIEIVQKTIPNALEKLEKCIKDVSTLKDTAINTFASQTEEIFEIIGPKAVDFFNQKFEVESQLNDFYDKEQNLYRELAEKQEEVSCYSFLISATEKHLKGAKQELEETKRRTYELQQLNVEIEQKIQNFTAETVTKHRSYFFRMISRSSKVKDIANLKAEKKYYDSIILSRMARVREHQEDKAEEQKVMKDLDECLSEYKSKYKKAKAEFDKLSKSFDKRMQYLQDQINILHNQLKEIDKKEINTENITGLQGKTLISCLITVRKFSHTITGGAAYAPLISILDGIKNMVQSDIKLLSSSNPIDIFIAGNRLLAQFKFFSRCSADLNRVLQPIQYKSIENAVE